MTDAREHHLQMKYMLAQMAVQDPQRFWDTFGPNGDGAYFADLWTAIGQKIGADSAIPNDELGTTTVTAGETTLMVLTFPTPMAHNEAYYLAMSKNAGLYRVWCLESAAESKTMLTEFVTAGRANWGVGPDAKPDELVAKIDQIINDPTAAPVSLTQL